MELECGDWEFLETHRLLCWHFDDVCWLFNGNRHQRQWLITEWARVAVQWWWSDKCVCIPNIIIETIFWWDSPENKDLCMSLSIFWVKMDNGLLNMIIWAFWHESRLKRVQLCACSKNTDDVDYLTVNDDTWLTAAAARADPLHITQADIDTHIILLIYRNVISKGKNVISAAEKQQSKHKICRCFCSKKPSKIQSSTALHHH